MSELKKSQFIYQNQTVNMTQSIETRSNSITINQRLQRNTSQRERPFKKLQKRQAERVLELKQQLLAIRERKSAIPKVPDPQIVEFFTSLKLVKQSQHTKGTLIQKIQQKKKELKKFKEVYLKSQQQYQQKSEIFRQKSALQRVLAGKMDGELGKTKQRFRQVEFNKVIIQGIRKVLYYRLAEILFNSKTRNIFSAIQGLKQGDLKLDEDSIGICLGYLGLFMTIVSTVCGAKTWINFTFRGSKSTIKANDSSIVALHPKQPRLSQGLKLLNEQLYQIMQNTMGIKIENPHNFYQLCEQLSKQILTIR